MVDVAKWEICVHMANELYPMDVERRRTYVKNCMKDDRAKIWKKLFPNEVMPDIEENAVEKYAGSLDKYLARAKVKG